MVIVSAVQKGMYFQQLNLQTQVEAGGRQGGSLTHPLVGCQVLCFYFHLKGGSG